MQIREELERLAAELAAVGPPPPTQLYRTARRSDDLVGPMLHVAVGLDMMRFERETALHEAALIAIEAGYDPAAVARASGLDAEWLLDRLEFDSDS
jgi:hypothetical protein